VIFRKKLTEKQIKKAYDNYADSHWTPPEDLNSPLLGPQLWGLKPMMLGFEQFATKCKMSRRFYKKYKKEYPSPLK